MPQFFCDAGFGIWQAQEGSTHPHSCRFWWSGDCSCPAGKSVVWSICCWHHWPKEPGLCQGDKSALNFIHRACMFLVVFHNHSCCIAAFLTYWIVCHVRMILLCLQTLNFHHIVYRFYIPLSDISRWKLSLWAEHWSRWGGQLQRAGLCGGLQRSQQALWHYRWPYWRSASTGACKSLLSIGAVSTAPSLARQTSVAVYNLGSTFSILMAEGDVRASPEHPHLRRRDRIQIIFPHQAWRHLCAHH